ncbi:hypothetical protein EMIHUDRAFT_451962 [Emiliania huxleyi CCMP1516]|uniref:endopeptidase La n=2 Tax=Emiliania huxleyi TaxID=2903 RepID=A0A0D3IQH1_EMIH1|nr:hypothetical protein EMIHUDRAFT_451962 [Emiliania huxleyi CCMP1516]EOD13506.1 hypothetical protein EMIHUDRAFT_451962 [Emiliania huxleyi CCMP1516]|eukprot:XP_005765935.1 hypothetical protein EMIHUDRAFT_451962 [Emiliania huxleyi CCMP1516]
MISGLISEIERQVAREPRPKRGSAGNSSEAPVHFRIYTSKPPFPGGLPPPIGLPFMPGGPSGGDDEDGEVPTLERRLRAAGLPAEAEEVVTRELRRLRRMSPMHSEYSTLVDYLEWMAELPWAPPESPQPPVPLSQARAQLEEDHYAMDKVKQRILEFLAVCHLRGDTKGSILCMLGPPGIGKTSLGKSVAAALGRPFHRVSVGGIHSEAEVRGHRRTYVGALPGLILQAVKKCGAANCVIMLDEVDKLGRNSYNGDPSSALLEVLDPEQNGAFRDHFLAVPFNLSQAALRLASADDGGMHGPVIELTGYTVDDKVAIAARHLLPKQAGVRELERKLGALCRAIAANRVLGPPRFEPRRDVARRITKPGIALGLAATVFGGETLFVEVEQVAGKGAVQMTGNIKEVMQESVKAALTWIRANVAELGLAKTASEALLNTTDLHIHFPEGATPKDGPSAGVTITTALTSLLTGRLVRNDVAMTGEITLRGLVLPVGGIKEKVVAAHRAGVRTVLLPQANEKDLRELPQKVLDEMQFELVSDVREVIRAALVPADVTEAEAAGSASGDGSEPATDDGRQVPLSHPLPSVPTGVP